MSGKRDSAGLWRAWKPTGDRSITSGQNIRPQKPTRKRTIQEDQQQKVRTGFEWQLQVKLDLLGQSAVSCTHDARGKKKRQFARYSFNEDASPEVENDEATVCSPKSSRTSHEVAKRCLESSKTKLISTCIQVLKEPSNAQEGVTQCHFSKYVSEKLASFDRRTRLIAEMRISDILRELEKNDQSHQIMGQSHFTHSPSGASGFASRLTTLLLAK